MTALNQVYVDSDIGTDSGDGSSGDPYGNIQYALDQTSGATEFYGTGSETLSGALDFSTRGAPSFENPCLFKAQSEGAWTLDGGAGNFSIINGTDSVGFCGVELTNTGTAAILTLGFYCFVEGCQIHDSSGNGITSSSGRGPSIFRNYLHDIGGIGISVGGNAECKWNYLANGTKSFSTAIQCDNGGAIWNIISIGGTTKGIVVVGSIEHGSVDGNSILNAGTGTCIELNGFLIGVSILNNLIRMNGASGTAIDANTTIRYQSMIGQNAVYVPGGATAYDIPDEFLINNGDNETLSATPFAESGSDTFANRFVYFEPQDTGNVISGAYPVIGRRDKGAVQSSSGGGGSTVIVIDD